MAPRTPSWTAVEMTKGRSSSVSEGLTIFGRPAGITPMRGASRPRTTDAAVAPTSATRDAGTFRVSRGKSCMVANVAAPSSATGHKIWEGSRGKLARIPDTFGEGAVAPRSGNSC